MDQFPSLWRTTNGRIQADLAGFSGFWALSSYPLIDRRLICTRTTRSRSAFSYDSIMKPEWNTFFRLVLATLLVVGPLSSVAESACPHDRRTEPVVQSSGSHAQHESAAARSGHVMDHNLASAVQSDCTDDPQCQCCVSGCECLHGAYALPALRSTRAVALGQGSRGSLGDHCSPQFSPVPDSPPPIVSPLS